MHSFVSTDFHYVKFVGLQNFTPSPYLLTYTVHSNNFQTVFSLWYLHVPFLTASQNNADTTWCRKSSDYTAVRNICRRFVFCMHQVQSTNVLESQWCHPVSSPPMSTSAMVFEHGRWQDMLCVARNSYIDRAQRTGVFSWKGNKYPMQHVSECFCHIVLKMAQNTWVEMLIHRISL